MSTNRPRFRRGETVLYRGLDEHGQVIDVKPVVVVEDADAQVVLWLPLGTPTIKPELLKPSVERPRRWDHGWRLVESTWRVAEALIVIRPGEFRAIWVSWSHERVFQGWSVNIQSRLRRTHLGFDIQDYQLDILVEPDRSWRLKDEDELALAVELGRLTAVQGEAVRAEGQRAVDEIERNEAAYADGWENWRPNGEFKPPKLIPGWDDVSMYSDTDGPKVWRDDLRS